MGVQAYELSIPGSDSPHYGVLVCTTSDHPFGPLLPSFDAADAFDDWVRQSKGCDPRSATLDLEQLAVDFLNPVNCEREQPHEVTSKIKRFRMFSDDDPRHPRIIALCEVCAAEIESEIVPRIEADENGVYSLEEIEWK